MQTITAAELVTGHQISRPDWTHDRVLRTALKVTHRTLNNGTQVVSVDFGQGIGATYHANDAVEIATR